MEIKTYGKMKAVARFQVKSEENKETIRKVVIHNLNANMNSVLKKAYATTWTYVASCSTRIALFAPKKKWKPIYTVYEPTYVVLCGRKCKFMWFYAVYAKRPHIYSHWSLSSPQGQCLGNTE